MKKITLTETEIRELMAFMPGHTRTKDLLRIVILNQKEIMERLEQLETRGKKNAKA